MAQLRLSAHTLAIETGRYNGKNKYVPPEERFCQSCKDKKMEDELHFLIECERYKLLREELYSKLEGRNVHFKCYNAKQKLVWLLSSENMEDIKDTGQFIIHAFEQRVS